MKKCIFLFTMILSISSCSLRTIEYNIQGNWSMIVVDDSVYTEVRIDTNSLYINYMHDAFVSDKRYYLFKNDTLLISWPNKPKKYSKYIFKKYNKDKIILHNITFEQTLNLYRISDSEFTVDEVTNFEEAYKYEVASKNRMFKLCKIDSLLIFNYKEYIENMDTLNIQPIEDVEIPIEK